MTNAEKRIAKLKAQIAALEKQAPKLKATGKYDLLIKDTRDNVLYTMEGYPSREKAKAESDKMWRVLVAKLKQKVKFSVVPQYKKIV